MSLEEEARQLAAQIADAKATAAERAAKDQEKRALEQTPAPPSWTAELIDMLDGRYPDHEVYRVECKDEVQDGYRHVTTFRYGLLGRGWGLESHWLSDGTKTVWGAVLMRNGNLHHGGARIVETNSVTKHVGLPPGAKAVLLADDLLTHSGEQDVRWREIFGLGGAVAILTGEAQATFGGLEWPNRSRYEHWY